MRDVQDWNFVGRIPGAQVVENFRPGRVVERDQRLVEQERRRIRHQRSRERHALALAAGNLAGLARDQMRDAKRLEHRHHSRAPLLGRHFRDPVLNVLRDRQMGKQREILKHVSQSTLRHRHVDALIRIEEHSRAERYPPGIRPRESRDAIQQGRLSAARRPQDHREAGRRLEFGLEREAVRESDARCAPIDARRVSHCCRMPSFRNRPLAMHRPDRPDSAVERIRDRQRDE